MNKKRRSELNRALVLIETAKGIVEMALFQEESALDNIPENFESSDMYIESENAVEAMEGAIENLDEALDRIREALS